MTKEPARLVAYLVGVVQAGLLVAISFGVNVTQDQLTAILGFIIAVGAITTAEVVRSKVTPVASLSNSETISELVGDTPEEQAVIDKIISRGK